MIAKKLLYVPGLISLMGLPILLLIVHPEDPVFKTALKLNIPAIDTVNHPSIFTEAGIDSFLRTKNIEEINLNEWVTDDLGKYLSDRKRMFLTSEIERLQFINDTNRVLKVKFGDENSYQDFMYVLNLAKIYKVDRYVFMNDAFYLIANTPPRHPDTLEMTFPVYDLGITPNELPTAWDYFKWQMEEEWQILVYEIKRNLMLSIGFVLLIALPALINLFRKRNVYKKIQTSF